MNWCKTLPLLLFSLFLESKCQAFSIHPNQQQRQQQQLFHDKSTTRNVFSSSNNMVVLHATKPPKKKRGPSRVSDPAGPTPADEQDKYETVDVDELEEMKYDPNNHPIPHQPWRRGDTAGCEAPIDAEWRREGEELIRKAVELVGGRLLGVTWYLTSVIIHIDNKWEEIHVDPLGTASVNVRQKKPIPPRYYDWDEPNPEPILDFDDDEEDDEEEEERKLRIELAQEEREQRRKERRLGFSPPYEDDDPEDREYVEQLIAEGDAEDELLPLDYEEPELEKGIKRMDEYQDFVLKAPRGFQPKYLKVDTRALSTIASAIYDTLEYDEERLQILSRHKVMLASPGPYDVLETQKQFDAHRGEDVAVETRDPWDSNRTIRGKLVDRNAMDVILNQQGRMVTIPLNFVRCVRLKYPPEPPEEEEAEQPESYMDSGYYNYEDEDDEEEYEEDFE